MTQDPTKVEPGPGESSPGPAALHVDDAPAVSESAEPADAIDRKDGAVAASSGSEAPSAAERPADPAVAVLPAELAGAAQTLFGERLDLAAAYAELLATEGVVRGLIGPREAPRIWDRHLLNCAAVAELIPSGSSVLDVGSGAGLPGLVLAIARPDLTVTLIEPLARRTSFLLEAVQGLGLAKQVRVLRGRADEAAAGSVGLGPLTGDIVTARAVAPLDRLATWCLPLTVRGGRLLALKGSSVAEELAEHAAVVERLGGGTPTVHRCGDGLIDPPTTVVEIVRERVVPGTQPKPVKSSRARRGPARPKSENGRTRRR